MMFWDVERRIEKVRFRWWVLLLLGFAVALSHSW
jgi:hypothetical protein